MKKLTSALATILCTWTFILIACSAPLPTVNVNGDGLAIKGYDAVAYFTEGRPAKGEKGFQHEWQGAAWLFSSQQHLDMFKKDPEKYAPQYGGY